MGRDESTGRCASTSTRRAGILLHPLSLPGSTGCGTLDHWVGTFLNFCRSHHQSIWQVLPLGPTGYGNSPYQSFSTHAGNPYLISLEQLQSQGLATEEEVAEGEIKAPPGLIDYCQLWEVRRPALRRIAAGFEARATAEQSEQFEAFCEEQAHWLHDYALFTAIKEIHEKSWQEWPTPLRKRHKKALTDFEKEHAESIKVQKVIQWFFDVQWQAVRSKAQSMGIEILGDIPIFVALDSADAWSNPELFLFDKERRPTAVAGVPPDYFSEDGQLWGNPLYRWEKHEKTGFAWWKARMASALRLYDRVRIDHFRGFAGFWKVPAEAKTAREGEWVKAPGDALFKAFKKEFGEMPVVAEDLGDITPDVHELREKFELPGMKVLQFAFSDPGNEFLPHNYQSDFVVYTGTHDNDTTAGWYTDAKLEKEHHYFRRYVGLEDKALAPEAVKAMIRLALQSVAELAIVPYQDLLSLSSIGRMNTPSEAEGNWQWRLTEKQLLTKQEWFMEATWLTGRAP